MGYSEVRSPIAGAVADRPIYEGEMANAGAPLITVMDASRVVARANVPQQQAAFIKVGDAATIAPSEQGAEIPGKVTVVSPATDPASTTVQVWVEAANAGGRLKPGESVHVAIVVQILPDAVVVPPAAILPGEDGGNVVMVVGPDNVAHRKAVELGIRESGKVQILSGASPGEQVIAVGGVGLDDGAKVRVVQPGAADEDSQKGGEKPEEK